MYVYIYIQMCVCVCICPYIYIWMYMCICVCVCVCVCLYHQTVCKYYSSFFLSPNVFAGEVQHLRWKKRANGHHVTLKPTKNKMDEPVPVGLCTAVMPRMPPTCHNMSQRHDHFRN